MKILIINGPNLNLLGKRETGHYGVLTIDDIEKIIKTEYSNDYFEFFQSNIEGEIVGKLHGADSYFDGVIINPGGYAHTSVAIRDALEIVKIPKIEVHLSNLSSRDDFRQTLITAPVCNGYLSGFKENSYLAAIYILKRNYIKK
ncbi:MAG: type II 3-dehydroquinate dehydratase [bacterium]